MCHSSTATYRQTDRQTDAQTDTQTDVVVVVVEVVLNAVVCSALLKEMTCDIDVPLLYCDFEAVSNTVD